MFRTENVKAKFVIKTLNKLFCQLLHTRLCYIISHTKVIKFNIMYQFKVIILGESGVGKTSIAQRFCFGGFNKRHNSTVGAAFLTQSVYLDDNTIVKFDIWDTAGQERYQGLVPLYYRGARAALVVYDINNHYSFEKAKLWVQELRLKGGENIVVALAGNKYDLQTKHRAVSLEEAQQYASENNILFEEVCAKTCYNITETFIELAQNIVLQNKQTTIRKNEESMYLENVREERVSERSFKCC